jgi:hypothetical protein
MSMTPFPDSLKEIELRAAAPYLEGHGWQLEREGTLGDRWALDIGGVRRNIAVPRRSADPEDRLSMLLTVVRTLGEVEQRDPELVARDLESAANDIVEFRVRGDDYAEGEIPLFSAPDMAGGVLESLQAAARAEVSRRPFYGQGQLPAQVRAFLDDAKLGTAKGSVILRVRPPAPPWEPQESLEGLPRPDTYERRVIRRLVDGVRAAKAVAHSDPTGLDLEALDESVDQGLSANLCRGLSKVGGGGSDPQTSVEVRVRWSLLEPTEEPATLVELDSTELQRFDAVAQVLRGVEPRPNYTVVGPVTQLKRIPGNSDGRITIEAEVDLEVRPVNIEVGSEDYELAAKAHLADSEISATGLLEHAGRSRELTHVTAFEDS